MTARLVTASELAVDPLDAAPFLLGCVLEATDEDGTVAVRLTEVEAYRGTDDPASHCYRGPTPRNAVMFGPPGHLYVYFVYGMHYCANIVCATDGVAGAVLLRGGEVVAGEELARKRRPAARSDTELAKGPARLTSALAVTRPTHNGVGLTSEDSELRLRARDEVPEIASGPRVGVAAAEDRPWRYWVVGAKTVSPYRRGGKRNRTRTQGRGR